jgi:hypothetical protein
MAQEIIYTSAPQGLRPGTYGFCTVAATAGMPGSLIERLEALSGYRHLFPPGTPEAAQNPVVYSHVVLKLGTRRLHVVSRVADAGLDYSQRSNKLAHHVALEENEVPVGGPAWLSSQGNLFHTQWNGAPRTLPAARTVPQGLLPPLPCPTWARLTGDAGWAGLLAQHAFDARRPAYVIVPAGADALALLREAQALLPERKRWEVSYSTCFTKLPAGVDCLWRCVVAGTPEAEAALAQRSDLVIDASHPLPPAPAGRLVTAARTGELPPEAPRVAEATRAAAPPRGGVAAPVPLADDDLVAMPPLVRGGAAGRPTLPPPRPQAPPALKRKRTWRSRAVLALGMLLMIGGLGTAGYYLAEQGSLGDLFADVVQHADDIIEQSKPANTQTKTPAASPTALPTADTSASAEVPPMPPPVVPTAPVEKTKAAATGDLTDNVGPKVEEVESTAPTDEEKSAEAPPAATVIARDFDKFPVLGEIPLPLTAAAEEGQQPHQLWRARHSQTISSLRLLGPTFATNIFVVNREGSNNWAVSYIPSGSDPVKIAVFSETRDGPFHALSLTWLVDARQAAAYEHLNTCVLEATFNGPPLFFMFKPPDIHDSVKLPKELRLERTLTDGYVATVEAIDDFVFSSDIVNAKCARSIRENGPTIGFFVHTTTTTTTTATATANKTHFDLVFFHPETREPELKVCKAYTYAELKENISRFERLEQTLDKARKAVNEAHKEKKEEGEKKRNQSESPEDRLKQVEHDYATFNKEHPLLAPYQARDLLGALFERWETTNSQNDGWPRLHYGVYKPINNGNTVLYVPVAIYGNVSPHIKQFTIHSLSQ